MVLFNYSTKELTAKIVYYGPGLCGKTTNLQFIYESLPGEKRGRMLSLSTQTDRTLYFDFLPMDLGEIRGMNTRIQLYTVPGQVFYNETRKMVLKGVDGVVFVADSQAQMADANLESFGNLIENLEEHGLDPATMSLVLQFNKRDLPSIQTVEEMNAALNRFNAPFYEAIATTGIGVHDTLKAVSKLVLRSLSGQSSVTAPDSSEPLVPSVAAPAPEPAAVAPDPVELSPPPSTASTVAETVTDDVSDSELSWDDDSLESQLDGMDAAEIEGLLQEVEGLDLGPEDAVPHAPTMETGASPDMTGGDWLNEPSNLTEDDTLDMDGLELDALPNEEPLSPADDGDDLFSCESEPEIAFEPEQTVPEMSPEETPPSELAGADAAGGVQGEAPSFESFLADQGPNAGIASDVDDGAPATTVQAPAATGVAVEASPVPVQLVDGGQISIPVVLEQDGRPVRYTLTLRLQPDEQTPA